MSINITKNTAKTATVSANIQPRDAQGRFASMPVRCDIPKAHDVTNLDSAPKEIKEQILENARKLNERDALKEGAPFLYNIIEQNRILSDARKYNQLANAIYLGRGEDAYYLFKFSNKSSASGTIFGFHYNCGNLEDIVSHADAIGMLKYMEHYDNIQKFTF